MSSRSAPGPGRRPAASPKSGASIRPAPSCSWPASPDITRLPAYGRIKAHYIPGQPPASTALAVPALALPGLLIEVEAIAVR